MSKRVFGLHGPLSYEQLNQLSTLELIQLHNAKAEKQVKVFHTKAKGMQRVWELYAAEQVADAPATSDTDSAAPATTGEAGTSNTTTEEKMAKKEAKKAASAAKKAARAAAKGAGKTHLPGDAKIKVMAKENPYKKGTKAAATFELFAKCDTVEDFRKKSADKDRFDPGYIKYSSRDGYIKVG